MADILPNSDDQLEHIDAISSKVEGDYNASQIQVLEGLEAVRKRPGMYVGDNGKRGLHQLFREVLDNSVDEALAGHCDTIEVIRHADNSLSVKDNGRGIPVDKHEKMGVSALQVVMTVLHAGGKFGGESSGYKTSGGLHGVGVSCTNALSEWMESTVRRNGKVYRIRFERGIPVGDVREIGTVPAGETGTHQRWLADDTVLTTTEYDVPVLKTRMKELAYLNAKVRFTFQDEQEPENDETFYYERGIPQLVEDLNDSKDTLHPVIFFRRVRESTEVEIAFQYHDGYNQTVLAFSNNIHNPDGGTHVSGFQMALTRVLNAYAKRMNFLKEKDSSLTADAIATGLTAVISLKLENPSYNSQDKVKLVTPEVQGMTNSLVGDGLTQFLEENPKYAKLIIDKAINEQRAREAARKAAENIRRGNAMDSFGLPGKLTDCISKNRDDCELFLVEGDSAGGCFVGDTAVALASGTVKTLRELAEDWALGVRHFGYATNAEGDVRVVPLEEPRLTKRGAELVEVELDNGEVLRCTPDHRFRLRDGGYQEAASLRPGDSLMPLKTRLTEAGELPGAGYEMVWMNARAEWWHTHHLADLHNLLAGVYTRRAGNVRHHVDFNKLNNDPRNIERMPWRAHQRLHSELCGEMSRRLWADSEYRARKVRQLSAQAVLQWQDPEYRRFMSEKARLQRQDPVLNARLLQGFQDWFASLDADAVAEYGARMCELQAAYWSRPENRRAQSERTRDFFERNPQARETRREAALLQWEDAELRAWRAQTTREEWQAEGFRERHSQTVRGWWQTHPEHREKVAAGCERRWADPDARGRIEAGLGRWRRETSRAQKGARIRDGHRLKALVLLQGVTSESDPREAYEARRREAAPTALSFDRLVAEHFDGRPEVALEAARNVNCKVVEVRRIEERQDVYDLTVDRYHNFALAAGVFVHNSAKGARDRQTQAVLPLRGKILNVERARLDKALDNEEIKSLIAALGVGIDLSMGKSQAVRTADEDGEKEAFEMVVSDTKKGKGGYGNGKEKEEPTFDITKLRYGKIIIMTDADVDGEHIRTLLLTFFYRYMKPLMDAGNIYLAQPPLFVVKVGNNERYYAHSVEERDELIKQHKKKKDPQITRFKGLGEMNADELEETTMNPANRKLVQVHMNPELEMEIEQMFSRLMGEKVEPRRAFIEAHARQAHNVDWHY